MDVSVEGLCMCVCVCVCVCVPVCVCVRVMRLQADHVSLCSLTSDQLYVTFQFWRENDNMTRQELQTKTGE